MLGQSISPNRLTALLKPILWYDHSIDVQAREHDSIIRGDQTRLSHHAMQRVTGDNQNCTRLRFIRIGNTLPLLAVTWTTVVVQPSRCHAMGVGPKTLG